MARHLLYVARLALRASLTVALLVALSSLAAFVGFWPAALTAIALFVIVRLPDRRAAAVRHALRWGR
ncbi:MAG: hypothetical protein HYR85_15335 [Planctomycetes bacterium]|nr:hypothetical protein [Planctomycetota bacterium]MBI3846818.1 hypothetical protein [Planctomycetota bacterium]